MVVVNVVGLSQGLLGRNTPNLNRLAASRATIEPAFPAVTCTAQTNYLTGTTPQAHGIVGNGWYFREVAEIAFWKQADALVQSPRLWEAARRREPSFTVANVCWWYAMYSSADYTVTPRPMYPADGRKFPDCWTHPATLRDDLQAKLGVFPLFKFWGPMADITSTRWIVDAAVEIDRRHDPTLSLVYLPHLDYCLQKFGPADPRVGQELKAVDAQVGRLAAHFQGRGAGVLVLSEYGIEPVSRPVHLNRTLREAGLLAVRTERGRELLDPGASDAFAVADHQIAHVYVKDARRVEEVRRLVASVAGVGETWAGPERLAVHLDHPRAGDVVAEAEAGSWFTYYYWLDEARAPDFARIVDIHRKPGYDPVELFVDAKLKTPALSIGRRLVMRKMGFRQLLDVISTDASLVRGSHGRRPSSSDARPVLLSSLAHTRGEANLASTEIYDCILRHLDLA